MGFAWLGLTRWIGCGGIDAGSPAEAEPVAAPDPAGPTVPGDVAWRWPLLGRVTSDFGPRNQRHHDGIDITATPGTPVEAAGAGTVVRAEWWFDYGRLVEIAHPDGRMTRYAHLDTFAVKPGDVVETAAVIGTVGSTGRVTGPHLHFELIENGEPIDPIPLVIRFAPSDPIIEAIASPVAVSIGPPTMFGSLTAWWNET